MTAIAVDTIKTKQPDLLAVHLVDLDSMRHEYGVLSDQAKEAVIRMDRHLGQIIDAMKEMNIYEDTVLAVMGDHYQIDTHTVIRPNYFYFWIKGGRRLIAKGISRTGKCWQKPQMGLVIFTGKISVSPIK